MFTHPKVFGGKRANFSITEYEEFILPDWSPPDILIQSEHAKRANS